MEDKENVQDKPSAIPPGIEKRNSRESLKDISKRPDADEQQPADGKQQSVPFPAFSPKWPLTHSERIEELDRYLPFYENSPQRHNIIALKEWHAQYPGDEIVSNETVWFERGKKVEPSEIVAGAFEVWEEGPPDEDYSSHTPGTQAPLLPGPAATVMGKTTCTYYERAPNSHMYQLKLEARVSVTDGGTGLPLTMDVNYDSGCSKMALSLPNAQPFLQPAAPQHLQIKTSQTASGLAQVYRLNFEVRHLSRDGQKELVNWYPIICNCYPRSSDLRIFRGILESDLFIANHPHLQRLYVARTRAQLFHSMPKGR